jgi:DNA transformation protein
MDYLLDQLRGCGPVSARRMFGEFCLYLDGRPVGLVCDEQLFLKPSEAGRRLMQAAHGVQEGAPFPGARPHLRITADDWDDHHWLGQLVRATFDSLPPPKPVKPRAATPRAKPAAAATCKDLPNLGPRSCEMLRAAGITSVAQLRALGSVAAFVKVRQTQHGASLNLLWALEGALTGLHWREVAQQHRTSLLLALEQAQRNSERPHP